jgi:hypothetical protein
MICARLKPAVSGLEKKYPGRVAAHNVDATTPDARNDIHELGFKSHGLVVRSAEGIVLFKQADHTVRMDGVEEALHEILAAKGPGA